MLQRIENIDNVKITDQDTIATDVIYKNVSLANFLYLSQQPNTKCQEKENQNIRATKNFFDSLIIW